MTVDWATAATHLLCPPGDGVYAPRAAGERRRRVQAALYGEGVDARAAWAAGLDGAAPSCALLGIPSDTGGGIQRGANWGPLFVREALLARGPLRALDLGDVRVIPHLLDDKYLNEATLGRCRVALYGDEDAPLPVSPLSIAYAVATAFFARFPSTSLFTIGGDHSASYPVVRAWAEARVGRGLRPGLVHVDAHTDLMDDRLGIDVNFATWARRVLPALGAPSRLVQLGIRGDGRDRADWEARIGHRQIWCAEIHARGPAAVAADAVAHLRGEGVDEVYLSFDVDALDETCAGATGTPEPGGLTTAEALDLVGAIARAVRLTGADVMEVAPQVRPVPVEQPEPETTLAAAAAVATLLIDALSRR